MIVERSLYFGDSTYVVKVQIPERTLVKIIRELERTNRTDIKEEGRTDRVQDRTKRVEVKEEGKTDRAEIKGEVDKKKEETRKRRVWPNMLKWGAILIGVVLVGIILFKFRIL